MTNAGQIDVKLGLNSEEFIQGISSSDKELKKLEKDLKGLGDSINTKANPAVDMLSGALKKLAGPAIAVAVGKKLVDMGKAAVDTAAKFESLSVSFEVLTGGAEAGKKLTNQIIELAAKTPLTTEALTDGARTLLAYGESAEEVVNDLKLLGNIAGNNTERLRSLALVFSQIGTETKLTGENLRQMAGLGFNPLETMAKKTGKSMAQLRKEMSEGKITFNDVKQAMIDATSEGGRFNGMMEKQSQTLEGLKATNQDTWEQVSKAIGDWFLPAAKAVQKAFIAIGNTALKALEKVKKFQEGIKLKIAKNDANALISSLKYQEEKLANARTEAERKKWTKEIEQTKKWLKEKQNIINNAENVEDIKIESKGGFSAMSSIGGGENTEAVKKAKKQKDDLLNISKDYAAQMADIESYNTAKSELMADGGRFQRNYEEKLRILQWYHNERYKITQAANGNLDAAQEQFNQLEELKNRKFQEANISDWSDWGKSVKSIVGNSLNTLLTTTDNFGDAMINVMNMIYQSLIKMALDKAMEEIKIAKMEAAIKLALNAMTGGIGGAVTGLISKFPKFHSGGVVPGTKEQIAVLKGGERVLNPAENTSYTNGQGGELANGVNNIMMFNIKAWDGKDVINTLKSNSQTINQIVASGIKNNNQGLRTTVQNI
jgi:tape measure domain-containing protein